MLSAAISGSIYPAAAAYAAPAFAAPTESPSRENAQPPPATAAPFSAGTLVATKPATSSPSASLSKRTPARNSQGGTVRASSRGNTLKRALKLMAEAKEFKPGERFAICDMPEDFAEKSKVRHCLALVDYLNELPDAERERTGVLDIKAEVETLRSASRADGVDVSDAVDKIATSCLAQLLVFEDRHAEVEKQVGDGLTGYTDSISGMAKRVSTYRKRIKVVKQLDITPHLEIGLISEKELKELETKRAQEQPQV